MKPKELIIESIKNTIGKELSDLGFTFLKSSSLFQRVKDDFKQVIKVHFSKYNSKDYAGFWLSFAIDSKVYSGWYKKIYGQKPVNDCIAGEMDWNIPGWAYPDYEDTTERHFEIANEKYRASVLQKLKENILLLGIPFLNEFADWENAAHRLVLKEWFHSQACDLFLIANNKSKAHWALQQGIEYWKRKPEAAFPQEKEEIALRLKKYFTE